MAGNKQYVRADDGLRIAYEVHGHGIPAIVFVHGWSCDRTYWKEQLEAFAENYTVVAVDVAGHGDSDIGRDTYTMESFGSDVANVVSTLQLHDIVLVGHSMGGDVILEAARRLQGKVLGLVWVDTYRQLTGGRSPENVESIMKPLRENFTEGTSAFARSMFLPGTNDTLVEKVVFDMSSALPSVAKDALYHALSYSREVITVLKELNLSTVAINPSVTPGDIESLEKHGVKVVNMHGVGHFPMMEDPEQFNDILSTVIMGFMK